MGALARSARGARSRLRVARPTSSRRRIRSAGVDTAADRLLIGARPAGVATARGVERSQAADHGDCVPSREAHPFVLPLFFRVRASNERGWQHLCVGVGAGLTLASFASTRVGCECIVAASTCVPDRDRTNDYFSAVSSAVVLRTGRALTHVRLGPIACERRVDTVLSMEPTQ